MDEGSDEIEGEKKEEGRKEALGSYRAHSRSQVMFVFRRSLPPGERQKHVTNPNIYASIANASRMQGGLLVGWARPRVGSVLSNTLKSSIMADKVQQLTEVPQWHAAWAGRAC